MTDNSMEMQHNYHNLQDDSCNRDHYSENRCRLLDDLIKRCFKRIIFKHVRQVIIIKSSTTDNLIKLLQMVLQLIIIVIGTLILKNYDETLLELKGSINVLSSQIMITELNLGAIQKSMGETQNSFKQLLLNTNLLNITIRENQLALYHVNDVIAKVGKDMDTLSLELSSINSQMNSTETSIDVVQTTISKQSNSINTLTDQSIKLFNEYNQLTSSLITTKLQLSLQVNLINDLNVTSQSIKREYTGLRSLLSFTNESIAGISESNINLLSKYNVLNNVSNRLNNSILSVATKLSNSRMFIRCKTNMLLNSSSCFNPSQVMRLNTSEILKYCGSYSETDIITINLRVDTNHGWSSIVSDLDDATTAIQEVDVSLTRQFIMQNTTFNLFASGSMCVIQYGISYLQRLIMTSDLLL
jgi:hypothetical protein